MLKVIKHTITSSLGNKGVDEGVEADPDQAVAYYEVALGNDRRFDNTRDNVVPFTPVGNKTSVTFKDLDLEPGFAVYYFTVRAYSIASTTATTTSNGFFVSFDGGVTGKIAVTRTSNYPCTGCNTCMELCLIQVNTFDILICVISYSCYRAETTAVY